MASKVLFYSFKVWISALLIGSILLVVALYVFSSSQPSREDVKFIFTLLGAGSVCSIPSLLLMWIGAFFINGTSRRLKVKRLWVAVLAVPLTFLPFVIIAPEAFKYDWQPVCLIAGLYYLAAVAGIFFYRLPERAAQQA